MLDEIVIATGNQNKFIEISHYFQNFGIKFLSLKNFENVPEVIEDCDTLEGNAIKKAREIFEFTGLPAMSDDTGLEVDALGGRPGVYSARYAGENATYDDNIQKLLEEMKGVPFSKRTATFKTVIAFAVSKTNIITVSGECNGFILEEKKGSSGFGYDSVFFVSDLNFNKTFAEMSLDEKNKISHRAMALKNMKEKLVNIFGNANLNSGH
jgi:XTP/dITP diphosphohydrolase